MNYPVNKHNKRHGGIILTPYIEPIRSFVNGCENIVAPKTPLSQLVQKAFIKLVALALLVGLNTSAFAQIGNTSSYYSDIESSRTNTFIASSLNFTLTPAEENKGLLQKYSLENNGLLNFQYTIHATGTEEILCDTFSVEAKRDGVSLYNGALNTFSSGPFTHTDTEDWEFIFTDNGASSACTVDIEFIGWQENFVDFGGYSYSKKNNLSFNTEIIPIINEPIMHKATLEAVFDIGQTREDIAEETEEDTEEVITKTPDAEIPPSLNPEEDIVPDPEIIPSPEEEVKAEEVMAETNIKKEEVGPETEKVADEEISPKEKTKPVESVPEPKKEEVIEPQEPTPVEKEEPTPPAPEPDL